MKTTGQNRFSQRPTSVAAVSLAAGVLLSSSPLAIGQTLTPAFTSFPAALKSKITHVIVIFPENRSFDSLYGSFPGANGLNSTNYTQQYTRSSGVALTNLIAPNLNGLQLIGNNNADPRFPSTMPNHPVDISTAVPDAYFHGDLTHLFYLEQYQINNPAYGIYGDPKNAGGPTLSKFTVWSSNPGLVLSHYDEQNGGEGALAKQYVLADNAFHSAFGGSFLNHFWLVCACTPRYANAPARLIATFDSQGGLTKDGAVTPDGFAVNTIQSSFQPHDPKITDPTSLLPPQTMPTIGDRLSEKGISWAWYSGGWNDAVAGKADPLFQFHHQPLAYFQQFGDGTPARAEHLKDYADLERAIADGALPAVVFYKPIGELNEHPGYSEIADADEHLGKLMAQLEQSPQWASTAVIITPDENGGSWDHVAPPKGDRWGPGTRIPTIIVSPHARKGFVDHTEYDTTSILATLEHRFDLKPLGERDAQVHDLSNAFEP